MYLTTSKVLIQSDKKSDFSKSLVLSERASLLSDELSLSNEIQLLASNRLLQKVVDDLKLNVKYYVKGRFVDLEVFGRVPVKITFQGPEERFYDHLFRVYGVAGENFTLSVEVRNTSSGEFEQKEVLEAVFGEPISIGADEFVIEQHEFIESEAFIYIGDPKEVSYEYAAKLEIKAIDFSDVLIIEIRDYNPETSRLFIMKLIEAYNAEVLENKNRSTNNTLKFIDERLSFISKELFDIETELQDFKQANDVPLELSETATQYLSEMSLDEAELRSLAVKEELFGVLEAEFNKPAGEDLGLLIEINFDGEVPQAIRDYNGLIEERSRMLSATVENPIVQTLDRRIAELRQNIMDWVRFKKNETLKRIESLERKIEPTKGRINLIPVYEREMLQIMRQQVIKESLFTFLLQKREETALQLAAEVSNARIINDPKLISKVSPNKTRLYLLMVFLSMLAPAATIFIVDFYDRKVRSIDDIRKVTNTPFLGEIPLAKSKTYLEVIRNKKSVMSEMFRMILTNLKYLSTGEEQRVLLVTSSISGEGKTFVSINLAATMALTSKKVVLLGMDLRKPKLSTYLVGKKVTPGISNFLVDDQLAVSEIINPVKDMDNLYFIGSGAIPPNPNELILGKRTKELIDTLKKDFDYIIIDSPPVGLVADSYSLKDFVDTSLFITKFEYSRQEHLNTIQSIYENQKLPNPAIIINGVKRRVGSKYGSGYGYGYGYYEDRETNWFGKMKEKIFK
ncbi:MAG: polysaccharide biosynthesis tyrosine autokinase [Roseivirga sp.]